MEQYEDALASYDKALEIKPDSYYTWNSRGITLAHLGKYQEALHSFEKALSIKPDCHPALDNIGHALNDLEQYEEAIISFDRALEIKPDYYLAWSNRGIALTGLERYEEALASYDQALELKPDDYGSWTNRGIALRNLGRYEEAIESYNKALEIKPDFYEAWGNKGNALDDLEQHEEAIIAYDTALEINPNHYEILTKKSHTLYILNKYEKALKCCDKALKIEPDYHEAWNHRGNALGGLERYEEALASYDKALELKPDYYQVWINRGITARKSIEYIPSLHTQKLDPELNKRGYEGELASYNAGLGNINKNKHIEGGGLLHNAIGHGHYLEGKKRFSAGSMSYWNLWEEAQKSYEEALSILKTSKFEVSYLSVLNNLIQVLLNLGDKRQAQKLQSDGTDLLRKLLKEPKRSEHSKRQLNLKFADFKQVTVDLAIQSGSLTKALLLAEEGKNVCLQCFLQVGEFPRTEYAQVKSFVNPSTAAVYWHLSPAALTTFIIKSNSSAPILISHPRANSEQSEAAQRLIQFEEWMEEWDKQYRDYRQQSKNKRNKDHPWQNEMQQRLFERQEQPGNLKDILNISEIERHLVGIENLILMPHQDLHRFPLHALFSSHFTVTYLPSFQMGIMIKNRKINPNKTLLCVENPTQDLGFSRVEAEGIAQYFDQVKSIREQEVTKPELEKGLEGNFGVFHFAGHAKHVPENPNSSRLLLSNPNKNANSDLTLADFTQNKVLGYNTMFSGYNLVTLSACETALTHDETITSEYVGFVSGFLRSGAAQVVSTLWTVESAASALVMIEFYRQRSLGKSNSKALAAAVHWLRNLTAKDLQQWRDNFLANLSLEDRKRKTLIEQSLDGEKWATIDPETKVYDSPYYWAAFIISGQVT